MNRRNNGKRPSAPKKDSIKFLVFFDIDGTLLDDDQLDLVKLRKSISVWKKFGLVFGLNTNRPWSESAKLYEQLSFNGPIIAENGSYYKLNKTQPQIVSTGIDHKLPQEVLKRLGEFSDRKKNSQIIVSDDKRILLDKKIVDLLFITASRQYSSSVYVRRYGNINRRQTRIIFEMLRKKLSTYKVELLPRFGKIIIGNKKVNKFSTLDRLRKKFFNKYKVLMIGDDETAIRRYPAIEMIAVKQASSQYKKNSDYVAKRGGVEGIKEIINNYL
ncbi:MAG: HAD hydrolase family protein [Candidatus Buchananbacteria bacterium]